MTLSKKKANQNLANQPDNSAQESLTVKYLPSAEELDSCRETYGILLRSKPNPLLDVATYKVCESRSHYHILKTLDTKKPKVAILPKCLASSFGITRPFEQRDYIFEAVIIAHHNLGGEDN